MSVVDDSTGAPVNATVVVTCGSYSQTMHGSNLNVPTGYTGTCGIGITAPGFASSQTSVSVSSGCDSNPSMRNATASVRLMSTCGTTYVHDDGVGDSWADCAPAGTLDQAEASQACISYVGGDPTQCVSGTCGTADAGPGAVTCDLAYCWCWAGPCAGTVSAADAGAACELASAVTWH